MTAELLIRSSLNDHKVLADLLAPTAPGGRRPITRLVLSAQDVARRPDLAELVARSGTPLWVDPMTVLFQGPLATDDPWATKVPFGRADCLADDQLRNPFILDAIVAESLSFQVEHGASAIIAPYFYAERPESPAFEASLTAIGRTARRMRADGIALPLVAILCAQLRGFSHRAGWQAALDRFAAAAIAVGPQALGMYLSPVGRGDEGYGKVLDLLLAGRHLASFGVPVLAWRQGTYGPALVAAGLRGYECGMGIGEHANAGGPRLDSRSRLATAPCRHARGERARAGDEGQRGAWCGRHFGRDPHRGLRGAGAGSGTSARADGARNTRFGLSRRCARPWHDPATEPRPTAPAARPSRCRAPRSTPPRSPR